MKSSPPAQMLDEFDAMDLENDGDDGEAGEHATQHSSSHAVHHIIYDTRLGRLYARLIRKRGFLGCTRLCVAIRIHEFLTLVTLLTESFHLISILCFFAASKQWRATHYDAHHKAH